MYRPLASVQAEPSSGALRWNTAFRDLTHRFLFRPLTRRLGGRGALWVGFGCSGLVHDAVISVPAGGGYGGSDGVLPGPGGRPLGPSGAGRGRRLGLGGRPPRPWLFTTACLLGPARLVFHRPFVAGVVVPFLRAIGAAR